MALGACRIPEVSVGASMDRFSLPLGRRQGWMLITQIGLILGIGSLHVDPSDNMALVGIASVIAF